MLLKINGSAIKSKRKIRKYLETKDNENNLTQSMGHSKSSFKRSL